MIEAQIRESAVEALHDLVLHARWLAYDQTEPRVLASLLDDIDHLFNLMSEPGDTTAEFLDVLAGVSDDWKCQRAFDRVAEHLEPVS